MKKSFSLILCIILIITFAITSLGVTTTGVKAIKLSNSSLSLQVGWTFTLKTTITPATATNKKLEFSSANKNIATVDKNGKIKGINVGSTVITVSSVQNKKAIAKCTITVVSALKNKLTIKWIIPVQNPSDFVEGNVLQKEIESKFNVKIKFDPEDIWDTQKINLIYQSGDMPDFGFAYQNINKFYDQKLIRSIPEKFIRQYMPTFSAYLDADPVAWLYNKVPDKKNEYKAIVGVNQNICNESYMSYFRLDWLEKIGIKPKGNVQNVDSGKLYWTGQPFTLDELETICVGFTKKDPDGNGKNDTWAMTAHTSGGTPYIGEFGSILNAFGLGITPSTTDVTYDGNKLIPVIASQKYKDCMKYLHNLYAKGCIDPEWITIDEGKDNEKDVTGKIGYFNTYNGMASKAYNDRAPYGVFEKNPKAKILETPNPVGPDGKINFMTVGPTAYASYGFPIGRNVSDEKLVRLLMIFEYITSDIKSYVRFVMGPEGVGYTWSGEPWKSPAVLKTWDDNLKKEGAKYGWSFQGIMDLKPTIVFYTQEYCDLFLNAKTTSPGRNWISTSKLNGKPGTRFLPTVKNDVFGVTNLNTVYAQYSSELEKIRTQFYIRAINGDINIDNEWDNYVKSLYDNGIQKIIDEQAKGPLMDEFVKGKIKY